MQIATPLHVSPVLLTTFPLAPSALNLLLSDTKVNINVLNNFKNYMHMHVCVCTCVCVDYRISGNIGGELNLAV